MIWNPFRKADIAQPVSHPARLSQFLEAVALLFVHHGQPFNSWRDKSLQLTESEDKAFWKPCLTTQFASLSYAIEENTNSETLAVAALHSIFSIIERNDPKVGHSLHFFFDLNRTFVDMLVDMTAKGKIDPDSPPRFSLATMWLKMEADTSDYIASFETTLRLAACMDHAAKAASSYFSEAIQAIKDFDTDDIFDIYLGEDAGMYEEIVGRKRDYPEIFETTRVSLSTLIDAIDKDKAGYSACLDRARQLYETFDGFLCREDRGIEARYNEFRNWLENFDDLRAECFARGGQCKRLLIAMDEFRQIKRSTFAQIAVTGAEGCDLFKYLEHLFNVNDEFYRKVTYSRIVHQIRFIDDAGLICPLILISLDEEIAKCREAFDKNPDVRERFKKYRNHVIANLIASNSAQDLVEKVNFVEHKFKIFEAPE